MSSYSKPVPKKSPMGTSTLGSASPSQYMRITSSRRWLGLGDAIVNHMCRISPAPLISANGIVAPDCTTTKSAFPPVRSQLDARSEVTPGCNVVNPFSGPVSCDQQIALIVSSTLNIRFNLALSDPSLQHANLRAHKQS